MMNFSEIAFGCASISRECHTRVSRSELDLYLRPFVLELIDWFFCTSVGAWRVLILHASSAFWACDPFVVEGFGPSSSSRT